MPASMSLYNSSGSQLYVSNTHPDGFLYNIYSLGPTVSGGIYLPQYTNAGAGIVYIMTNPSEARAVQDNSNGYPGVIVSAGVSDITFLLFVFTF